MVTIEELKEDYFKVAGGEIREYPHLVMSPGICHAIDKDPDLWRPYIEKAYKSLTDPYEEFDRDGAYAIMDHEHNVYESPFGNDEDTGIIIDKVFSRDLRMHFAFEYPMCGSYNPSGTL